MGKTLDDSLFNGKSTKQTVNLNSSPRSPETVKLGSSVLLHWALKTSFLNYVVRLDHDFLKMDLFVFNSAVVVLWEVQL